MSNIIALGPIVGTNEAVPEIVAQLEEMLAAARRGEVRSLAYAYVDGGSMSGSGWVNGTAQAALLVAAVSRLQWTINEAWNSTTINIPNVPG